MIEFAIEPLETSWAEMVKLAEIHWNETQTYRHFQPFNPSFSRYKQYADIGCFIQFTARDEGRMVGYGGVYIVPSMHTQATIATEDTWFLLPEYRKGWNAIRFFKFMEAEAKRRGAIEFSLTTPYALNGGKLCEFLKYTPIATVWSKRVESVSTALTAPSTEREAVNESRCATAQ